MGTGLPFTSDWVTELNFNLINSKLARECESIKLIKQSIKLGKQSTSNRPTFQIFSIRLQAGEAKKEEKLKGKQQNRTPKANRKRFRFSDRKERWREVVAGGAVLLGGVVVLPFKFCANRSKTVKA